MSDQFEPVIIGFTCNWCSYRAADMAGTARMKYSPNIRLIRLMCSGRLDPTFVMKAFAGGADGVMITGCHPGDCHYVEQNYKALRRFIILKKTLQQFGIEPGRIKLLWASAAEGAIFTDEVNKFVEQVRAAWTIRMADERWRAGEDVRYTRTHAREGGNGMSTNGKPKFAMYWACRMRWMRDCRSQHSRENSGCRCQFRGSLLACGDGCKV